MNQGPPPVPHGSPQAASAFPYDGRQLPPQTQLREFQPPIAHNVSGPDGQPYRPMSPQLAAPPQAAMPSPHQNGGRPNLAPAPSGPNISGQTYAPGPNYAPGQTNAPGQMTGQWPQSQQPPQQVPGFDPRPNAAMPNGNLPRPPQPKSNAPAAITATVGKLTAPIPTKWRVAREQLVEIRLSSEELRALAHQLDGRGAAYAHERVIAKALSVRLKASDHSFAIEPTSPETLWLDVQTLHMSNDGVLWRWQATPQISGHKKLLLVISARTIGSDGVAAETALPDQSVTVKVGGNPGRWLLKCLGYAGLLVLGALLARYGEGGIETVMAWKRGFQ
jgi:neural Wiskott-Aldrich syndrome protein